MFLINRYQNNRQPLFKPSRCLIKLHTIVWIWGVVGQRWEACVVCTFYDVHGNASSRPNLQKVSFKTNTKTEAVWCCVEHSRRCILYRPENGKGKFQYNRQQLLHQLTTRQWVGMIVTFKFSSIVLIKWLQAYGKQCSWVILFFVWNRLMCSLQF